MKYLWLLWLPLLFLPNWGTEQQTSLGTLQIADYLIGPYLLLVVLAIWKNKHKDKLLSDQLTPLLLVFLWWIMIVTLLFPLRYSYLTNDKLFFSLLKIGKLVLYATAGMLTIKALALDDFWAKFNWSLLTSGLIVGINLLLSRNGFNQILVPNMIIERAYQDNVVSTLVTILIIYFLGLRLLNFGSRRWQRVSTLTLIVMTLGTFLSDGRGGWVAAFIGLIYLLYRLRLKRTLMVIIIGLTLIFFAYTGFPSFQEQIERTFWPDRAYLAQYDAGIAGIDDGVRLTLLRREGIKLQESPIFGRGFYHRAGLSGLSWWGSHNFFAQMFLETGIIGGFLVLGVFLSVWRQAGSNIAQEAGVELPVKAAILSAFVAGLSGEYFYGGMALFTLLLVYGAVGRLPYSKKTIVYGQAISASTTVLRDHQISS